MEYGIWNDEGLVEGGFRTREEAQTALDAEYLDDACEVEAICPDHREQRADNCEECDGED